MGNGIQKITDVDSIVRPLPEESIPAARTGGVSKSSSKISRQEFTLLSQSKTSGSPQGGELQRGNVDQIIGQINKLIESLNRKLRFTVHEGSGRMQVMVVNGETDKVIREIPPKEFLDMISRIDEAIGMIFDEKV
jgi:flagellar protein FlaG